MVTSSVEIGKNKLVSQLVLGFCVSYFLGQSSSKGRGYWTEAMAEGTQLGTPGQPFRIDRRLLQD